MKSFISLKFLLVLQSTILIEIQNELGIKIKCD